MTILDASAVLALLNAEPGAEQVRSVLNDAHISTINLAEVVNKLADAGMPETQINRAIALGFGTLEFGEDEMNQIGRIHRIAKKHRISLGGLCCLATALHHKLPVLTADPSWAKLKVRGLKIKVLSQSD